VLIFIKFVFSKRTTLIFLCITKNNIDILNTRVITSYTFNVKILNIYLYQHRTCPRNFNVVSIRDTWYGLHGTAP